MYFCPYTSTINHLNRIVQVKTRAESLEGDLDLLKAAFSEISRLGAEVAIENASSSDSKS